MTKDQFLEWQGVGMKALRQIETWPRVAGVSIFLGSNVAAVYWSVAHPITRGQGVIWLITDLAIGIPATVSFGRMRRTILRKYGCPECGAFLLDMPWFLALVHHCGRCGTRLFDAPSAKLISDAPSKDEYLARRTVAKRRLEGLARFQGRAMAAVLIAMLTTLGLPLLFSIGESGEQIMAALGSMGMLALPVWFQWRARQVLRMNGLLCPGCGKPLAPPSPLTTGRSVLAGSVAVADGVCGYCRTQVYRAGSAEASADSLPTRNEFLGRQRAFCRKQIIPVVIWLVGFLVCLRGVGIVSAWGRHEPSAVWRLVGCLFILVSLIGYFWASFAYWRPRLKRLHMKFRLVCPACDEAVTGPFERANGKCRHCGSRVYAREECAKEASPSVPIEEEEGIEADGGRASRRTG